MALIDALRTHSLASSFSISEMMPAVSPRETEARILLRSCVTMSPANSKANSPGRAKIRTSKG